MIVCFYKEILSLDTTKIIWRKDSWKSYPIKQQPVYPNQNHLEKVLNKLEKLPPLVFTNEIKNLQNALIEVSRKKAFLLQGGDCVESFDDFNIININNMFKILFQMAIILTFSGDFPVVKIGRIAGQFAKPRSLEFEEYQGKILPSFRGDIINDFKFDEKERVPNPDRILKAYYQSVKTLKILRNFSKNKLLNLNQILNFIKINKLDNKYQDLSTKISQYFCIQNDCNTIANTFYTSHEALLLPYEQAMTRLDDLTNQFYNYSAHMLWIGERTRDINGAHIHFLSGVKNPIGVKIGPSAKIDDLIKIAQILNPDNEEGRLVFIMRMGADKIDQILPNIFKRLSKEGLNLIYSIDPMHGNTIKVDNLKTREFDKISKEIQSFFEISYSEGVFPGGIHLEMTGKKVTECIGGVSNITKHDLRECYESKCDPRLNVEQAIELAFLIANLIKKGKK